MGLYLWTGTYWRWENNTKITRKPVLQSVYLRSYLQHFPCQDDFVCWAVKITRLLFWKLRRVVLIRSLNMYTTVQAVEPICDTESSESVYTPYVSVLIHTAFVFSQCNNWIRAPWRSSILRWRRGLFSPREEDYSLQPSRPNLRPLHSPTQWLPTAVPWRQRDWMFEDDC